MTMTKPVPWLMAVSLLVGTVFGWVSRPTAPPVVAEVCLHTGEAEIERLTGEVERLTVQLRRQRLRNARCELEAHGTPEADGGPEVMAQASGEQAEDP